jgi:hypothetical protein
MHPKGLIGDLLKQEQQEKQGDPIQLGLFGCDTRSPT